MPVVTTSNKVSKPAPKPGAVVALRKGPAPRVLPTLPRTPSIPVDQLDAYSILVHGEPGIGKTSLMMAGYERTLLITFDPPQKSLAVFQVFCGDWITFRDYVAALVQEAKNNPGNFPYNRIVLDGVDKCHQLCQEYVEGILGVKDISDLDWGKGWNQFSKHFTTEIRRLVSLMGPPTNCGIAFVSHSTWRDVQQRNGAKINKLVPLMKSGADREIVGLVDCVFAYQYIGKQHVLVVRGDEKTYAKCRIDGHFLTPKGERVFEVDMGNSAKEGWQNLLNAFANKQTFTHVRPPVTAQTTPVKIGSNGGGAAAGKGKPTVIIKRR